MLKRRQFQEVSQYNCRAFCPFFTILAKPNHLQHPRLGLITTKKIGSAPKRNLWKRRLREIFRTQPFLHQHPLDIIIIVKHSTNDPPAPLDTLTLAFFRAYVSVCRKLDLVTEPIP